MPELYCSHCFACKRCARLRGDAAALENVVAVLTGKGVIWRCNRCGNEESEITRKHLPGDDPRLVP